VPYVTGPSVGPHSGNSPYGRHVSHRQRQVGTYELINKSGGLNRPLLKINKSGGLNRPLSNKQTGRSSRTLAPIAKPGGANRPLLKFSSWTYPRWAPHTGSICTRHVKTNYAESYTERSIERANDIMNIRQTTRNPPDLEREEPYGEREEYEWHRVRVGAQSRRVTGAEAIAASRTIAGGKRTSQDYTSVGATPPKQPNTTDT